MTTTIRPLARASAGTLCTLLCAGAGQLVPEGEPDSEAARVAVAALARELGVDPETLAVAAAGMARYPNLDLAVQSFKIADRDGLLHGIAVDSKLRPADPEFLAAEERAVRRARFGALDRALAEIMERSGHEPIAVSIWVRDTTKRRWDRPAAKGEPLPPATIDKLYEEVSSARAAVLEALVAPVLERVRAFDPEARADELAPVIGTRLTADALRELARDADIDAIYPDLPGQNEMDVIRETTGIAALHSAGTTGRGVRVADIQGLAGIAENNSLLLRPVVQDVVNVCFFPNANADHGTAVAGVMIGRRVNLFGTPAGWEGTAPNIELRSGGSCSTFGPELQSASTRGVRWGARIVNLTWGHDRQGVLGPLDRYYDEIVLNEWRTVTKSAGNSTPGAGCSQFPTDGKVTSPGGAYNVITVGGFDDHNTNSRSDDSIYVCSSHIDPISTHGDREKPELAAPAVNIHVVSAGPANMWVASGTSGAAPVVAGTSALLMERNSRLTVWPEIIRAALMATAVHNIEGATRLSDIDGAGGLDASAAASLIDIPGRWDGIRYSCNGNDPLDLATLSVSPRTRHRVVLSWDSDPAFTDYETRPSADIDLRVVNANGATVASSLSFDGTNEIVEFDSFHAGTFTVRAVRFRCDLPTWLGWAWHTLPMPRLMKEGP